MSSWKRRTGLFLSVLFSPPRLFLQRLSRGRLLPGLLFGLIGLTAMPVQAASPLEQDFYHGLLLHPDFNQLRFGAKAVASTKEAGTAVLDVVAQRLWDEAPTLSNDSRDAVAWLARVLGESHQARYRELLGTVLTRTTDSKLKRHVQEALRQLPAGAIEQFVPGSIDLAALREQVQARQQQAREHIGMPSLQGLQAGASLNDVLASWGPPDASIPRVRQWTCPARFRRSINTQCS